MVERPPRMREIWVRSPVGTDVSLVKTSCDSSTARRSAMGECHRASEMTIIKV